MFHTKGLIASVQHAYMRQTLTSRGVIDDCLARIQACDQTGPCLNAVVAVNEQARDKAQELDDAFARTRQFAGPLHGIPVVVKDNFHTVDMPTRGSAVALFDALSPLESTVTRKLRAAGAIMLAKTNMHELALAGLSISSLAGQTLNPYDLSRTPGGSSGGTGAALAAGYGVIGLGTDTVNSVRSPASANCLVGLRPTRGLVSRAGVIPVAESQDTAGPLTHSVADAARVLDVIAGFDAGDPVTAQAVGQQPSSYLTALAGSTLMGARIGVMRTLFGQESEHSDVNAAMERALEQMREAGAYCIDIHDDAVDALQIIQRLDVQKWEFKELFNGYLRTRGDNGIQSLTELIEDGRFHKPMAQFLLAANGVDDRWADQEYLSRLAGMANLRDHLLFLMASHGVDVLVYPLQKRLVVPVGESDQAERNGIVAGVTGLPAINVPAGFSSSSATAPVGVPIGMDILGRPFQEARLLQIASAFERIMAVYQPPRGMQSVWSLWSSG